MYSDICIIFNAYQNYIYRSQLVLEEFLDPKTSQADAIMFGLFGGKVFNAESDIADLSGKTILVTGGNDVLHPRPTGHPANQHTGNNGLGEASCRQFVKHNAHVYLAARTPSKAESAIAEIKKEVPDANITFLELDLASLTSVKKAADTFNASSDRLDILLNNAGVMALSAQTTKDGYEIQFGTNHVGHALFTKLLMPTLQRTAEEKGSDVRIVNVSSTGHNLPPKGGLVLKDAASDMSAYNTWVRYGQSKLANILFTRELAKRHTNIKSMALHPGGVDTGLSLGFREAHPWLAYVISPVRYLLKTPQEGAFTQLFACTSPEAKSGQYYEPVAKVKSGSSYSQDPKLASELWEWTEAELAKHGY